MPRTGLHISHGRQIAFAKAFFQWWAAWHIACASSFRQQRKEVSRMKNTKSLLSALILLGSIAVSATTFAADGVLAKDEFVDGNYCHQKFQAMEGESLATGEPVLKSQTSGDVIDFYGPCDETPVGQDQVQQQRLDWQHRWASSYED
jgi:hypothetical protein